jgi:flagellar protein FliO/FliZ
VDLSNIAAAIAALAAVLGLILLTARLLRRFGLTPAAAPAGPRRLAVVETLPLDARRRLTLLRCDGRHLVLVTGGPQDVLLPVPGDAA